MLLAPSPVFLFFCLLSYSKSDIPLSFWHEGAKTLCIIVSLYQSVLISVPIFFYLSLSQCAHLCAGLFPHLWLFYFSSICFSTCCPHNSKRGVDNDASNLAIGLTIRQHLLFSLFFLLLLCSPCYTGFMRCQSVCSVVRCYTSYHPARVCHCVVKTDGRGLYRHDLCHSSSEAHDVIILVQDCEVSS